MTDDLEARLKSHARSFDSLLSLIPAKLYYGEDVSDQWQRKKQTPEQKRAAKMAKLDPENWKSAKDVMDERAAVALKRKRAEDEEEHHSVLELDELEVPEMKVQTTGQSPKKRKLYPTIENGKGEADGTAETDYQKKRRKAEQRAAKRERKQEAKAKARAKVERQQQKKKLTRDQKQAAAGSASKGQSIDLKLKSPIDIGDSSLLDKRDDDQASTALPSEDDQPEVFSPPQESGTSSISSIIPFPDESQPAIKIAPGDAGPKLSTTQTPRERLQAAILNLRAERKADGVEGQMPKTRQELLDQRRRKEEERRVAKKEQKRREREEEAHLQDEEIARRFSPGGSGSLLASPRSPVIGDNSSCSGANTNFSFGRIAFDDGTQVDPTISGFLGEHKTKGPSDTASALKAAQSKKSRLAGLDEGKRKEIEQKDMWLNAKKRAHGEHVRDDTNLLKKALKRQQGQKKKSEREWGGRLEGVQKAQEKKQKQRLENLAKRKDDKKVGKGKKVKRPGFEGSFKGRTSGKKR